MGKAIQIVSAIILVIVISSVAFLVLSKNNYQQSTLTQDPISFLKNCEALSGFEKEQCLLQKAALSGDISFCLDRNRDSINYSPDECYTEIAIAQRNPSICEQYAKDISKCKETYAINVLDSAYCEETGVCKTNIQQWLTKYTLQYSDCKDLNSKFQNSAFSGANNHTKQQQCFEFVAYLELEPSYCNDISFEKTKEQCKEKAKKRDYTIEECSTRMGYGHYRDVCYYQLAKQENSAAVCDKIVLSVLKDRCINAIN